MRAVVLREGRLEVRETPDPVPGDNELLLRVLSTAICASDVHFMDHHDRVPASSAAKMVYDADRDLVLGHEFVGEVIGYGPNCSDQFPLGSRVTSIPIRLVDGGAGGTKVIGQHPEAQGSFGELVVVSEFLARVVIGNVSNDAVALVDAFAVGEFYVRSSGIGPGEVALVVGAGAIGLSAVASLAARGIDAVIISDFNSERRDLAKQFGAQVLVDPATESPYDVVRQLCMERAATKPPVVFECVGAPGLIQEIVDSSDMWTRIYAAGGWYTGDTLDCTAATHKGVTIQFGGGPHPEDWYGTLDAVMEGRLDPLPSIGQIIGLDGVPAALALARKSQGPPRIVVHPQQKDST
jgi:threonine dehydrogenase-like Zn-dependent dehydrogenase